MWINLTASIWGVGPSADVGRMKNVVAKNLVTAREIGVFSPRVHE